MTPIPSCPSADTVCASQCQASPSGQRVLTRAGGSILYRSPCLTQEEPGGISQCEYVFYTGVKSPSICREALCYAQISIGDRQYWLPAADCATGSSYLAMPGTTFFHCLSRSFRPRCNCPDTGGQRNMHV